jgi:CRP/FNR family cyclic AMP-dependent transcriptional regulator
MSPHRHDPRVDLLGTVALFGGCNRRHLAVIARHTHLTDAADGTIVCRQGAPGQHCCVIVDGTAAFTVNNTTFATLGPGEFFGEIALLDDGRCPATVTANGHLRLLMLTRNDLNAVFDTAPTIKWKIIKAMGQRLFSADQALRHLHGRDQDPAVLPC